MGSIKKLYRAQIWRRLLGDGWRVTGTEKEQLEICKRLYEAKACFKNSLFTKLTVRQNYLDFFKSCFRELEDIIGPLIDPGRAYLVASYGDNRKPDAYSLLARASWEWLEERNRHHD